jgi:hypothetical protein
MSGREKIEKLTQAWYGFAVFSAVWSLLNNGLGLFSILGAVGSMLVSFVITYFIGRALRNRSSFTRFVLLVLSGLSSVFGAIGVVRLGYAFVQSWSLQVISLMVFAAASLMINVRSFRTLRDASVKAYVG